MKTLFAFILVAFSTLGYAQTDHVNFDLTRHDKVVLPSKYRQKLENSKREPILVAESSRSIFYFAPGNVNGAERKDFVDKKGNHVILEYDRSNFHFKNGYEIRYEYNGFKLMVNEFVQMHNRIYVVASYRKKNVKTFCIAEVDIKTWKVINEFKEIYVVEGRESNWRGNFILSVQKDETNNSIYLFSNTNSSRRLRALQDFMVFKIELDLNILWSKKETILKDNEMFEVVSSRVNPQGDLYILLKKKKYISKTKDYNLPSQYEIYSVNSDGSFLTNRIVNSGVLEIQGAGISLNSLGNVICTGIKSDLSWKSVSEMFYKEYNSSLEELKSITNKVSISNDDFINKTRKMDFRGAATIGARPKYIVKGQETKSNGDIVLLAEQYYHKRLSTTVGPKGASNASGYELAHGNILVANFDESGNVTWSKIIEKLRISYSGLPTTQGINYTSYSFNLNELDLNIFYNKEMDAKKTNGLGMYRTSKPVGLVINADGELNEQIFTDINWSAMDLYSICNLTQISNGSVVMRISRMNPVTAVKADKSHAFLSIEKK